MMKITGLSHLFKWENLHNWWLTKYFFAPLYISYLDHLLDNFVLKCSADPHMLVLVNKSKCLLYQHNHSPGCIPITLSKRLV